MRANWMLVTSCILWIFSSIMSSSGTFEVKPKLILTCPPGYTLNDAVCELVYVEKPQPVCKQGVLEVDKCVSYLPSGRQCHPGYTLIHKKGKKEGWQCEKVNTVSPTVRCPTGYFIDGATCRKNKVLMPGCPEGSLEVEGDCVAYFPTHAACPDGFIKEHAGRKGNGRCHRLATQEALESCPQGYDENDGKCQKTETVQPSCPPGSEDEGDRCGVYTPVSVKCPYGGTEIQDGKHKQAHQCVIVTVAEPTSMCEEEYIYDPTTKKCKKTVNVPSVCPGGTEEFGEKCAKYTPVELHCETGSALIESKYVKGEKLCVPMPVAPEFVCEDLFTLEGSECVKIVMNTPECPPGAEEVKDHKCIVREPALVRCPAGYAPPENLNHKKAVGPPKCSKTTSMKPTPICSGSFVYNEESSACEERISFPAKETCNSGTREGDKCMEFQTLPPEVVCPEDYERAKGKKCSRKTTYDCSTVEFVTQCHDTAKCVGKDCLAPNLRKLRETEEGEEDASEDGIGFFNPKASLNGNGSSNDEKPRKDEHVVKEGRLPIDDKLQHKFDKSQKGRGKTHCDKVAVKKAQTCEKVLYADANLVCPAGSQKMKDGCHATVQVDLTLVCLEGVLNLAKKRCEKVLKKAPTETCPQSFVMKGSKHKGQSRCVQIVFTEAEYYCEDWVLDAAMCVTEVEKKCLTPECMTRVAAPPMEKCPSAVYELATNKKKGTHSGAGATCVSHATTPPSRSCSVGELVDKRCVVFQEKECGSEDCLATVEKAPQYSCPAGLSMSPPAHQKHNKAPPTCTSTKYQKYEHFCTQEGDTIVGAQCVHHTRKACPNDNCLVTLMKPFDHYCPPQFSLHQPERGNAVCLKHETADLLLLCGEGEQLVEEKCRKTYQKSCPGGQCKVTFEHPLSYECPSGSQLKSSKQLGPHREQKCESTEFSEVLHECENGELEPTNQKCIQIFPAEYMCTSADATMDENGESCVIKKYVIPLPHKPDTPDPIAHKPDTPDCTLDPDGCDE